MFNILFFLKKISYVYLLNYFKKHSKRNRNIFNFIFSLMETGDFNT